jgi:hypothetical protein
MQKMDENADDYLDVELEFFSAEGAPKALYFALRATPPYSGAVETKSPAPHETQPRPGSLVIWQRGLVAAGYDGADFNGQVRQNIETHLMQFISDYSDGQDGSRDTPK